MPMSRHMNKDNQNLPAHAALHNRGPDPQNPSHLRVGIYLGNLIVDIYIYIYTVIFY